MVLSPVFIPRKQNCLGEEPLYGNCWETWLAGHVQWVHILYKVTTLALFNPVAPPINYMSQLPEETWALSEALNSHSKYYEEEMGESCVDSIHSCFKCAAVGRRRPLVAGKELHFTTASQKSAFFVTLCKCIIPESLTLSQLAGTCDHRTVDWTQRTFLWDQSYRPSKVLQHTMISEDPWSIKDCNADIKARRNLYFNCFMRAAGYCKRGLTDIPSTWSFISTDVGSALLQVKVELKEIDQKNPQTTFTTDQIFTFK